MNWSTRGALACALLALLILSASPSIALEAPAGESAADQLAYDDPGLYVLNYYKAPAQLSLLLRTKLQLDLSALGTLANAGFYDLRADRWGSLVLTYPLIPGNGAGNLLSWADLGLAAPADQAALEQAAWLAFQDFLGAFAGELRIDAAELGSPRVTVHEGGRLIQIAAGRQVDGVPVDGSYVHGVINSGNLVLYGTRNWGDVTAATQPAISRDAARAAVEQYVSSVPGAPTMREPALALYPMKNGDTPSEANLGTGFSYRLAWQTQVTFDDDHGTWRALVDAATGEVFSFGDQNRYATRKVVGGVQPVSNDGLAPDGIEQPGWPMPFADVYVDRPLGTVPDTFTNSGGVLSCVDGAIRTALSSKFVRMNDACGPINEAAAAGDLDLGTSGGTDCTVPPGHSPGDTHSSRTGFYEVNRIKEMASSWLPENLWLQGQLTANMNINATCNAFWNGSTINFYTSGGGCRNTGEIAAVFDHEWGHGMDANDAFPGISTPGEAPADHYAMFRLNTSCIGRGFFQTGNCGGQGDPCLACSGVRETDWAKRASGRPHNITWVKQPVVTPIDGPIAPRGGCVGAAVAIPVLQSGPCLQSTHCEGSVVSEAIWDLMHRDLAAAPFSLDENTRLNLTTRLGYLGGGNVNFWYQCVDTPQSGTGGCNSDSGYMNYLAADDDNGNLLDGTPHMTAIHAAFSRHQLACPTPTPVNTGCALTPATPSLTVAPLDNGAQASWNAVPGAQEYWLFRADGINGCEFGKERVAVTDGTFFVDSELLNGREYYYTVEAVGANGSCRSAASDCQSVIPTIGANLSIKAGTTSVAVLTGDGDPFLDNCETAQVGFELENNGNLPLTNVRIVNVEPLSHPAVEITSALPVAVAASLADCETAPASFRLFARGLAFDDTLVLRVDLTSDEMGGVIRSQTIEIATTESDFTAVSSHTFTFNAAGDLEGWERVLGNYSQLPGGPPTADADGSFLASSSFQDSICDVIQSPLIQLTGASTLSLHNQFSIEPPLAAFGNVFYDRANVGILDPAAASRTTVNPDGGRTYNASGPNGSCFTAGEDGWADAAEVWDESTWSAGALQAASFAGRPVRVHVAYGTDPTLSAAGFQFDFVTLTDFEMQGPDTQTDVCVGPTPPDAIDDAATTDIDTPVNVDVKANDVVNGASLSLASITAPANGSAVIEANETVTYTPDAGFAGSDDFDYTVCNDTGGCDTATVFVTVQCPAAPIGSFADDFEPTAEAGWTVDTAVNNIPTSTAWTVTADPFTASPTNAFFSDATTLDLKDDRLVTPALDLSAASRLTFSHRFNFESTFDGGVLEVSTDGGATWVDVTTGASFSLGGYNGTIDPGFGSPIAGRAAWTGFSQFINAMNQVEIDLGAFAGDGVLLRFRLASDPLVPGSVPGQGWWIDDVLVTGLNERPATCELPPIARPDAATTLQDTPVTIDVLANDSDPNDDPIVVGDADAVSAAGGSVVNNGGDVTYTPAAGFIGTDTFTYDACDPEPLCDTATVTVTVSETNRGPNAVDDLATTQEGTAVVISVLANDSDPDGDDIFIINVTAPANGAAADNGNGTVTYTPNAGFVGTDTFTYTICDDGSPALCDTATVTVEVRPAGEGKKITGGGWIPESGGNGKANFGFNAHGDQTPPKGRMSYHFTSGGSDVHLKGTVTSVEVFSASEGQFSGPCDLDGTTPCTYVTYVEDNDTSGAGADRFRIEVYDALGGLIHLADELLGGGNIQIH